jgi:hypothetical protein
MTFIPAGKIRMSPPVWHRSGETLPFETFEIEAFCIDTTEVFIVVVLQARDGVRRGRQV